MKWIKKATNIILIAVLALGISVGSLVATCHEASAIGVIGSNAVKQLVYGSWEKAGITFANKEAKERAFEAWNMKAYDKWKADEAAGKNKDLWDNFNAITQGHTAPVKNPLDDAPGVGKVLLDWTFAGMAIGIGAEIGLSIQENQLNDQRMKYLAQGYQEFEGTSYNTALNVSFGNEVLSNGLYKRSISVGGITFSDSSYTLRSPLQGDTRPFFHVTRYHKETGLNGEIGIKFYFSGLNVSKFGQTSSYTGDYRIFPAESASIQNVVNDMNNSFYPYEAVPKSSHVPNINIPEPLIELASVPIEDIPNHIPSGQPLEVIVPLDDTIWDGTMNEPYVPPTPGDNPDPDKPPGTDPDGDPDKPPGTDPDGDPDKPPGTDPDGDTDAPPKEDEETPPGKDEEQPPKEDEENSCGESLKKPDFKKVGVAFTNAFPFSLPWDLKRFFDAAFSGIGSEKPSVDLTFLGDGVTLTIPDYFDSWVDVAKNLMVILFDISLIWMFARFMQRGGGE